MSFWNESIEKISRALSECRIGCSWERAYTGGDETVPADNAFEGFDITGRWKHRGVGHLWYRTTVRLEEGGVDLTGCALMLRFFITAPVEIWINGELIYSERYWAECQIPEAVITPCARYGEEYRVLIHVDNVPAFDAMGDDMNFDIISEKVEELLFDLSLLDAELWLCRNCEPGTAEVCEALLRPAAQSPDTHRDIPTLIAEAEKLLAPAGAELKKLTVHLIGHAHIDLNWMWPQEETERICRRDFTTITNLMEENPDFCFSQSQGAIYEILKKKYPEIYRKVRKFIDQGRFEVTASTWSESDLNMIGSESLAHQFIISREFTDQEFGIRPGICWEPDTFGHPATLPGVLNKCGIRSYYHYRCGIGKPLYRWRGNQGGETLNFNSIYLNPVLPDKIVRVSYDVWQQTGVTDTMFVYGVGDHGGGPTQRNICHVRKLMKAPCMPRVVFDTAQNFFEAVRGQDLSRLPVASPDRNPVFSGCYITHTDIKRMNRTLERDLVAWENLHATRCLGQGGGQPLDTREPWKTLLFHQFHDILCGCAIRQTYRDADPLLEAADALALEKAGEAAAAMTEPDDTWTVWNTDPFPKKELVKIEGQGEGSYLAQDDTGRQLPAQWYKGTVYFLAEIPGLSGRSFRLLPAGDQSPACEITREEGFLCVKNRFHTLRWDTESGILSELRDPEGPGLIRPTVWRDTIYSRKNNCFVIQTQLPHNMPPWVMGPVSEERHLIRGGRLSLEENGSVFAVLENRHSLPQMELVQKIFVYGDLDKITFSTDVDWKARASAREDGSILRVLFRPDLQKTPRNRQGVAFGSVERPIDGVDYPMMDWVDLSDGEGGFLLTSDYKHCVGVCGTTVSLGLLQTSYGVDNNPDLGCQQFTYTLRPHRGDVRPSDCWRAACCDNHSFLVTGGRVRNPAAPPLTTNCSNLCVTSVKLSGERELTVRLFEADGKDASLQLKLGGRQLLQAEELSLDELQVLREVPVVRGCLADSVAAGEVKTYRLTFC